MSNSTEIEPVGGPEWIADNLLPAIPYLVIAITASAVGFCGNVMVLITVVINTNLRHASNVYLVNLACADLLMTGISDPFSIVGILKGKDWFNKYPWLCDFIATFCLTTCVTALLSMGGISYNRYMHICHPTHSNKVFSLRNNIILCMVLWGCGFALAQPALWGWTSNIYDPKYMECIWNRLHSTSFTLFFSLGIVFTPVCLILFSYLRIFLHFRASNRRVGNEVKGVNDDKKNNSMKLAKTMFMIFSTFVFCWSPYALLIVFDTADKAPMEVHLYILLLAHLHATANPIIYYFTNQHFKAGYRMIFNKLCHLV